MPHPVGRLALLSVHASPLAQMGDKKTGGMNVYIYNLAKELGERGIRIDIYTRRLSSDIAEVDGSIHQNTRVIHIAMAGTQPLSPDELFTHLPEFTTGVLEFTTRHNLSYDLIFSHYWLSGWVAQRLKNAWNIPFVQMFHTLGQMKQRIAADRSSQSQRTSVETQIMAWANHIIAATPAEQAQLRWLYRASRRKITVISPGVDLNQFRPVSRTFSRARISLPDDVDMLLFVGRIEPLKGVDTAIEALAYLLTKNPALTGKLRFIIVGGKPDDPTDTEMTRLQKLVADFGLSAAVQFIGARDQSQLPDYYTAATAVIMPSDYESFGMVALEAMASGTPVIASDVGGLAFLVRSGVTGYLVPVRDAHTLAQRIETLIENPAQLELMRKAAVQLAREYTWSKIADDLLMTFERVLAIQSRISPRKS